MWSLGIDALVCTQRNRAGFLPTQRSSDSFVERIGRRGFPFAREQPDDQPL